MFVYPDLAQWGQGGDGSYYSQGRRGKCAGRGREPCPSAAARRRADEGALGAGQSQTAAAAAPTAGLAVAPALLPAPTLPPPAPPLPAASQVPPRAPDRARRQRRRHHPLGGAHLGPPAAGGGKDSSCNRLRMAESGSLRRRPGGLSSTGTWGFRRAAGGRRAAKYPRSGLLKYVAEQRAVQSSVQSSELDAFLEEVER